MSGDEVDSIRVEKRTITGTRVFSILDVSL